MVIKIFSFFDTDDDKKVIITGFRSAGIIQAIKKARAGELSVLDPYMQFFMSVKMFSLQMNLSFLASCFLLSIFSLRCFLINTHFFTT